MFKQNFFKILACLFFTFNLMVKAQISPGELTKAHSNLEGMSNCTKCHELGESATNDKCLSCHSEIKQLIFSGKGFHAAKGVKNKNCFECHSEHNGRNFKIVNFDSKSFDHNKTGYELTGAHSAIDCNACHQLKFISSYISKKKSGSYLGLSSECETCHEDIHQSSAKKDCSSCHTTKKFKPAEKFNHNTARFVLTGLHQKVECSKCHPAEMRNDNKIQKFAVNNFSSCKSCHNDAHKGKYGGNCESCHNTSSFHNIAQGSFDHNKTEFPLLGKHKLASCSGCHKNNLTANIKYENCSDCHQDYHKGELVVTNLNRDCSECHTEIGFTPSNYTIEKHNLLKFQLTGAHLAVPCQGCHQKNETWHFRNVGTACIDCHINIHGNELTAKYFPESKCDFCHNNESWKTITFNHSTTEFILEGKHRDVSCGKCHSSTNTEGKIFRFASSKSSCESCHKDIHFGQFTDSNYSDCLKCHSFENWKPEKFDHEKTKFSLKGAHSKLVCGQCHKPVSAGENTFIKYILEDFKCASCHT